ESGASTQLNLRALGPQRGLILLDGRRLNPSTATGVVDVAILPEELVQRVDIVTGGASAAYGSDAVAGVVNFILDSKFTGFKSTIQGGVTDRGDNVNGKISASFGTPIGERLHLILSGTFYNAEGVQDYRKREWFQSCAPINSPGVAGGLPARPLRLQRCGANTTLMAPGGLIVNASAGVPRSLINTQFLEGGVPAPFQIGTLATRTMMIGGTGEDQGIDFQPLPELRRVTGYGHLRYEASDNLEFFADALIAQSKARYRGTLMQFYDTTALTIYEDNAFLPESIRQIMNATPGVDSITVGTSMPAVGFLDNEGISDTKRFTVGLKGEVAGWTVDAYYEYGTNLQTIRGNGNVTIAHVFDAVDAVRNPANGQIVCRTQLTNPGHECVPYNIFGANAASQQAVDFVRSGPGGNGSWTKERTRQHVVEVAARSRPFSTWAGEVGVALGAGYRKDTVKREVDPGSNGPKISCLQTNPNCANPYPIPRGVPSSYLARPVGAYFFSNQQPITGGYDVWEMFGEVAVPLARDKPFLQSLDLSAAARYTHYSLSGGVTTWKAGLTWQPIEDIRFRTTRSRDIRAANMTELYSTSAAGAGAINERLPNGTLRTSTVVNLATGNPDLKPEKADTFTAGAVFSPTFLPGLQLSADYYDIDISQAIGQLGGQNIVDQCVAGATELCKRIERDADGIIFRVNNGYLNISRMKTSGLDLEASYRTNIGADSSLMIRAIASHVFELSTQTQQQAPVDRAGQTGLSGGIPSWNFNIDVNLKLNGFSLGVNERIIGKGTYNATFVEGVDIDDNKIPAIAYTDLTASYRFDVGDRQWEVFGTVNNLLDQDPPWKSGQFFVFGTIPTNAYLFDTIGRAYTIGLRIKL
ncbi:MAG: TonB-dependent receptor, partial [Sphingomonadales bacterium]|nr:TonB-dependent receptor [Sphingomonadales bacterium]